MIKLVCFNKKIELVGAINSQLCSINIYHEPMRSSIGRVRLIQQRWSSLTQQLQGFGGVRQLASTATTSTNPTSSSPTTLPIKRVVMFPGQGAQRVGMTCDTLFALKRMNAAYVGGYDMI
jgi:hypothetical protein